MQRCALRARRASNPYTFKNFHTIPKSYIGFQTYNAVVTHGDVYLRCKNDPVGASPFKEFSGDYCVLFNDFIILTIALLNHPINATTYKICAVSSSAAIWLYKTRV